MMTMISAVATASAAPELRSAIQFPRNADPRDATTRTEAPSAVVASGRGRQVLGWLEDAGLLLLLVLAVPLVILVVGTPVALVVRLLIEISRRWW
jgi:hypothetical protein